METENEYKQASIKTASNLKTIAHSMMMSNLSKLSLPEVDAVVDQIAQVVPAGNIPGVILSGLSRLTERRLPTQTVKRDVNLMFKGVRQVLDKTIYGTLFAGPAAVIWGYQNLLKLAGKDIDDSFPEGTWQFYVDYALREDTARHVNESHGFYTMLNRYHIQLSEADQITAWVMAAVHCLHQYQQLLENEWRERTYTYLLRGITETEPDAARYAAIYRHWERERPYNRGADATGYETYPLYRKRKFNEFIAPAIQGLRPELRQGLQELIQAAEEIRLPAYQKQMSILAYLDPDANGETRTPISLKQAQVGLIYRGRYYLIPICAPQSEQPIDVTAVRAQVAAMLTASAQARPTELSLIARTKRAEWANLRKKMNPELLKDLDMLRLAPILLNCDHRPRNLPLAEIRQTERGIGDHALTILNSGETMLFDQSHIFFDGAWGAMLAEVMTNEALSWAVYLNQLPPSAQAQSLPHALNLKFQPAEWEWLKSASRVMSEASAETDALKVKPMLRLRKLFKLRSDLLQLTVNDLLLLYRAIHAVTYQADPNLLAKLKELTLSPTTRTAALNALQAIQESRLLNPVMVIPVDASQRSPRDRLYPMTFEVPMTDLDFLNLHQQTVAALMAYKGGGGDRTTLYVEFDRLQRRYLSTLAGFGAVLSKVKEVALSGESASVGSIRMLANIPTPLQRMLDAIPGRIDLLNDLIKGREVFSNVGVVVPSSTLTRFTTAKDDNDKKTLAWGVITDANGVMRLSLRDFRPHVAMLELVGQKEVAHEIAQDYLNSYVNGLNDYILILMQITESSRETRLARTGEE